MNKKQKHSFGTRHTFLEWIISVGIFTIISVFLLELFLVGNSLQQKAKDQGKAMVRLENIAEQLKMERDYNAALKQMGALSGWGDVKEEDSCYVIGNISTKKKENGTPVYVFYYDKDWNQTKETGIYSIVILPYQKKIAGNTVQAYQGDAYRLAGYPSVYKKNNSVDLFHLNFAAYTPIEEP